MSKVDSIRWDTNIKDFLEENEISKLQDDIIKIQEDVVVYTPEIMKEFSYGLSQEALSIEGRAPLYELAMDLLNKMKESNKKLATVKNDVKADGNTHRKAEANRYYKVVKERYNELRAKARAACEDYNNNRSYTETRTTTTTNEDGSTEETTETITKQRRICSLINEKDADEGEIAIKDIDTNAGEYCTTVQEAVKNAQACYNPYFVNAKKKKAECESLDTSSQSEYSSVRTTAKKIKKSSKLISETKDRAGNRFEQYLKDGKMISITYDKSGNIKTIREYSDEAGTNLIKRTEYNQDGSIKESYTNTNTNTNTNTYGGQEYVTVRDYYDIVRAASNGLTFMIPKGSTFVYDDDSAGQHPFNTDKDIYFAKREDGTYGILNEDGTIGPAYINELGAYGANSKLAQYIDPNRLIKGSNNNNSIDEINTRYISPEGRDIRTYTQDEAIEVGRYEDIKNAVREFKPFKIKKGTILYYDRSLIGEDTLRAEDEDRYFAPTSEGDYGEYTADGEVGAVHNTGSNTAYLDRDLLMNGVNNDDHCYQNNTRYEVSVNK